MKIGIGIDTGGTCTDGVIYDFEQKRILACGKTPTTKEDLTIGIGKVLDQLPEELLDQAEMVALSTTLATNACVENKGGRGKLIFIGMEEENVRKVSRNFGLPMDDTLIFLPCKETLQGEIIEEPDWEQVRLQLKQELADAQAVGIVELFAAGTGAAMEKKVRDIVEAMGLPAVCGYELFQEKNVIGRGAGALLNARLIFVIAEFLQAVKGAMKARHMELPVVIVRSDGSLMNEDFSRKRPIETLLCGPVASVMGAAELHQVQNAVVVDMGGTTTDISIIRDGAPVRANEGITVGDWSIYVRGLYVDTFGLGGDTEVDLSLDNVLVLGSSRIMPICMAAKRFPRIRGLLEGGLRQDNPVNSWRNHIYVGLRRLEGRSGYSSMEQKLAAALYQNPMTFVELEKEKHISIAPSSLNRLVREGILIRCGITPTDAMHVLGDYNGYDTEASLQATEVMANILGTDRDDLCRKIYEMVEKRLYCNIVRILFLNQYPTLKKQGFQNNLQYLTEQMYEQAVEGKRGDLLQLNLATEYPLIGVGGPIGVFLNRVAELLGTKALLGEYSSVANALGAIVGNVEVGITLEITPVPETDTFRISGNGVSRIADTREEAEQKAEELAQILAEAEAVRRGAVREKLFFRKAKEVSGAVSGYGGEIFLSELVTVTAGSKLETV